MKEIITVQVQRPNLELLNETNMKAFVEDMARDIADQIIKQEQVRLINEQMVYWDNKFLILELQEKLKRLQNGTEDLK